MAYGIYKNQTIFNKSLCCSEKICAVMTIMGVEKARADCGVCVVNLIYTPGTPSCFFNMLHFVISEIRLNYNQNTNKRFA